MANEVLSMSALTFLEIQRKDFYDVQIRRVLPMQALAHKRHRLDIKFVSLLTLKFFSKGGLSSLLFSSSSLLPQRIL